MGASAARKAALAVATRVRERNAYAHETLDSVLSAASLEPRDAAFATRLAYGTVSCRGTLDEAVGRFVDNPGGLEPRVTDALAVSAYEILFARTPARAAVNEGVELVKSVQPRAAGLANAVLRKLAAAAEQFPWGDPEADDEALARLHGHPAWVARLWIDELGREQAASVMAADNEPAPLFLAYLPFVADESSTFDELAGSGAKPSKCPVPGCITVESPAAALGSASLGSRAVVVADAGAQLAAHVLKVSEAGRVVELGAGRGTKSLIMAGIAHRAGAEVEVVAVDVHEFKLKALRDAALRAGASNITTVVADATDPTAPGMPPLASADAVLVDAPCSGLGTLRRHPDRRWRARPEEIASLAGLGEALLRSAARLVKPGGFVVYSTCTIASAENAAVVKAFLDSESGADFAVDPLGTDVPDEWARFVSAEGFFQSVPEVGGPDGHFIARLVRVR
jgi:16S rRNA (cytosine967-C5)-methyltransferase